MSIKKSPIRLLITIVLFCAFIVFPVYRTEAAEVRDIIYCNISAHTGASDKAEWITQAICYASSVYQVDPFLITAVMQAESDFDFGTVSDKGAVGLMQLMPETAEGMGINPYEPLYNVIGGTLYLRNMLNKFADCGEYTVTLALAAYNAGPQAVIEYGGCPPYRETVEYIRNIAETYNYLLKQYERS